jgi:hypothetical protein
MSTVTGMKCNRVSLFIKASLKPNLTEELVLPFYAILHIWFPSQPSKQLKDVYFKTSKECDVCNKKFRARRILSIGRHAMTNLT